MDNEGKALIHQFCEEYQFRLGERTLIAYRYNINDFFTWLNRPMQSTCVRDIRQYMGDLQKRGQKSTTICQKMASLRLFFFYLMDEEVVTINPVLAVTLPQLEDKLPVSLSQGQLQMLRELVKGSLREQAIIETMYATGVRLGELVDMNRTDINWGDRSILIRKGKGKKERIVLFSHYCKEILTAYLRERQDEQERLFLNSKGAPIQPRTLRKTFEKYTKQLGVKVTPHTMRHTFAAHLAKKGLPLVYIQDLLGHDTIEVTKLYARLDEQARKTTYDYYL
ncbi:tyrosine-type recombinase/integrase [Pontibacillus yanchengensis]|uniref:Tyrosine-type recombinase/integrase n=1 Tax=Pontibacillus yanchengensis TaxID=462910 RepID=A0A6I4ZVR0_9BACI|nr:tyrosine-type recombinase/integrase [Pontibacillus yanchengensis]MYL34275.1 tyrosine-type recombinase/integrase [Pontibacillus yanchengensis]